MYSSAHWARKAKKSISELEDMKLETSKNEEKKQPRNTEQCPRITRQL